MIVQALGLAYVLSENYHLKAQIADSADVLAKSARTVERMIADLSTTREQLSVCKYHADKYQSLIQEAPPDIPREE